MVVWTSFCGDALSGIVVVPGLQEGDAVDVAEVDQPVLLGDTPGPGVRIEVSQLFGLCQCLRRGRAWRPPRV